MNMYVRIVVRSLNVDVRMIKRITQHNVHPVKALIRKGHSQGFLFETLPAVQLKVSLDAAAVQAVPAVLAATNQ